MKLPVFLFFILLNSNAFAKSCMPLSEPLTTKAVEAALTNCSIHTTQDLRLILPPSFRSNFTFVRKSASAFAPCINPKTLSPRLIMFSPKSDLVIAMPWNFEMLGNFNCNAFETMELVEGSTAFDLKAHFLKPVLPTGVTKSVSIAEIPKCVACHSSNGIPIWAQYSNWKSKNGTEAYGAQDDVFIVGSDEAKEYGQFLDKITKDGSGYSLIWPEHANQALERMQKGFNDQNNKNPLDFSELSLPPYQLLLKQDKGGNYDFRPNNNFTENLQRINLKRISNQFKKHPLFEKLNLMLAFSESNCSSLGFSNEIPLSLSGVKDLNDSGLIESGQLIHPYLFGGESKEFISNTDSVNVTQLVKYIGMTGGDLIIDPNYPDGKMDTLNSLYSYNDGNTSSGKLLSLDGLSQDARFSPYLIKSDSRYGKSGNFEGDFILPYANLNICRALRSAMDQ